METLTYLLKSAALLSLFFLGYEFLLKKDSFFAQNRWFLLLGLATSIVLPFVVFTKTILKEIPFSPSPSPVGSVFGISQPGSFVPLAASAPVSFLENLWQSLTVWDILTAIYLIGVAVFALRFVIQLVHLSRLMHGKSHSFKKDGFVFIETGRDLVPFSFFNRIVYNPKKHSQRELNLILNHEKAHAGHYHNVDILLAQLLVVFMWFNPLSYLYRKRIGQNLEFLADREANAMADDPKVYQRTLVCATAGLSTNLPITQFNNPFIKTRIIMLHHEKSPRRNRFKTLLIIPFLALFLMGFQVNTTVKKVWIPIPPQPKTAHPAQTKVHPFKSTADVQKPTDDKESQNQKESSIPPVNLQQPQEQSTKKDPNPDTIRHRIFRIDKNDTEKDLERIKTVLKDKFGIEFTYKNLKLNADGKIIRLTLKFNDHNGHKQKYQIDGDSPIEPIFITVGSNKSVSMGNRPNGKAAMAYPKGRSNPIVHSDAIILSNPVIALKDDSIQTIYAPMGSLVFKSPDGNVRNDSLKQIYLQRAKIIKTRNEKRDSILKLRMVELQKRLEKRGKIRVIRQERSQKSHGAMRHRLDSIHTTLYSQRSNRYDSLEYRNKMSKKRITAAQRRIKKAQRRLDTMQTRFEGSVLLDVDPGNFTPLVSIGVDATEADLDKAVKIIIKHGYKVSYLKAKRDKSGQIEHITIRVTSEKIKEPMTMLFSPGFELGVDKAGELRIRTDGPLGVSFSTKTH